MLSEMFHMEAAGMCSIRYEMRAVCNVCPCYRAHAALHNPALVSCPIEIRADRRDTVPKATQFPVQQHTATSTQVDLGAQAFVLTMNINLIQKDKFIYHS